jgi:HEAT repeat protein
VNVGYLPGPEFRAQHALIVQGAASVPILIAALESEKNGAHYRALDALAEIGPAAKEALPAVERSLRSPDESLHSLLVYTKWRIDGDSQYAVAHLVPLLQNERERACGGAVNYLWYMGPDAKEAVPALIDAMRKHKDHGLVHALDELCQWFAPEILPAFREALADPELEEQAVCVLVAHEEDKEYLLPYLVKMLNSDPDPPIHPSQIAEILRAFGQKSKSAVPGLIRTLKSPSGYARVMAAEALGNIGPDARAALPALTEALADKDVTEAAAEAMRRIRGDK